MANLCIQARRTISFTYAIRFYLKGKNKQYFFDFLQKDLESDVEKLTARTEEDWVAYTDVDINNDIQLGEKFFKFKQDLITLRATLENHFNKCLVSIQQGLPEVVDDDDDDDEILFEMAQWTCKICKIHMKKEELTCRNCKRAKPTFVGFRGKAKK